MSSLTRRDLLFGLGGGCAGLALTPVPWKLIDDVSIWTQHRRALEVPACGPVAFKPVACALCPGGCALRVRTVGGRPVSLAGEARHPLGGGACALGLTLHHLAVHPLRVPGPARRVGGRLEPISFDTALATLVAALATARERGRSWLVLDRRPGRVVSAAWRELLAGVPNGIYATVPGEEGTLAAFGNPTPLGIDLERTRTLLSFGAPVLDGWDRPGRMLAVRKTLRVLQVDTWRSPSASLADEWLPVVPGGEGPLALALAHVLLENEPARASAAVRERLAAFAPGVVAARIGVDAVRIEALARQLAEGAPAVAIGGGEAGGGPLPREAERAIALLDTVLGAVGREGGIVPRRALPEAPAAADAAPIVSLADVAEGSVGVVVLDAADDGRTLPWPLLARTLAKDALVVSLSPFESELARRAGLILPAPAPLEACEEILPTAAAAVASFALSLPVRVAPSTATDPLTLVERLAAARGVSQPSLSHEDRLKRRVAAIFATGRGRFLARDATGYAEAAPADAGAAFDTLAQGGVWIDTSLPFAVDVSSPMPSPAALAAWAAPASPPERLPLVAFAARGTAGATPVSPLLTKLYQESDLRPSVATLAVHPATAAALGLHDGAAVRADNASGSVLARLCCDPRLPEGRAALAAGPDPAGLHPQARYDEAGAAALAVPDAEGHWRATSVRIREA